METMHKSKRLLLLSGTPHALACGGRQAGLPVADVADMGFRQLVAVHVVNDNYYSARVRAFYDGGNQYIIGTVESHTTADTFEIPWDTGALWFEVDLITGPGRYLSEKVLVEPGDIVELRLPPDIEESGFFRRIR